MMNWNKLNELLNVANHFHLVWDMMGAFSGREPSENSKGPVKGIYGIFGKKDERIVHSLIMTLNEKDQELLVEFFGWLFTPEPNNIQQWLESVFYRNDFFVFLAKKNESGSSVKIGEDKKVTVTKDGGKTITETVTKDLKSSPGLSEAARLIQQILDRIKAKLTELGPTKVRQTAQKRQDIAFRATYNFFKKTPVPMQKVGETDWIGYLTERFGWTKEQVGAFVAFVSPKLQWLKTKGADSIKSAEQKLADEASRQQRREAELPWLDWLIRKLLPF